MTERVEGDEHGASFETDRDDVDDQPARDDLLDPASIAAGEEADAPFGEPAEVLTEPELPLDEDLPESQGDDVATAARTTEDRAARPPMSDEESLDDPVIDDPDLEGITIEHGEG